jgi:hypothetical protein
MQMNDNTTDQVRSLGSRLSWRNRKLWNRVEREAFEGDSEHAMSRIPKRGKSKNIEFFLLYSEGKPVGRAAAIIGEGWLSEDERSDNAGFIDSFVIHPAHKHQAGMLIDHCLATMKQKGAQGIIVRSQGFSALAAQEFDDAAPAHTNPPWYINLFEQRKFVKHKEWMNLRLTLPSEIDRSDLNRWEALRTRHGIDFRKLKWRNRRELRKYVDVTYDVLSAHYGYTPNRILESHSFLRSLVYGLIAHVARFRIYVMCNQDGEIVGFFSYHPDYNYVRHSITKRTRRKWYNILPPVKEIRDILRAIRRPKRATIGAIGLREEARGQGLLRGIRDYGLNLIVQEGYKQLDTGPVLTDNVVVVKVVESIGKKYGVDVGHMRYYTLQYKL